MILMQNVVITAENGQIRMMKYSPTTDRPHTEYEFKQMLLENAKEVTEKDCRVTVLNM